MLNNLLKAGLNQSDRTILPRRTSEIVISVRLIPDVAWSRPPSLGRNPAETTRARHLRLRLLIRQEFREDVIVSIREISYRFRESVTLDMTSVPLIREAADHAHSHTSQGDGFQRRCVSIRVCRHERDFTSMELPPRSIRPLVRSVEPG